MKKQLLLLIIAIVVVISCTKEHQACEVGDECTVKSNVFNTGTYQPNGNLKALSVNKQYTNNTGKIYLNMLDSKDSIWHFPQEDLFKSN